MTGRLVAVYADRGVRLGKVRVGGALREVALGLLPDARVGDLVLVHAGVALSRVRKEGAHVPGDSGADRRD